MLIHRDGDRLVLESIRRQNLLEVLAQVKPLEPEDAFPNIDDTLLTAKSIDLRASSACSTPRSCPNLPESLAASLRQRLVARRPRNIPQGLQRLEYVVDADDLRDQLAHASRARRCASRLSEFKEIYINSIN